MALEFTDRVSARPGRVKITPENGGAPFYATMERADMASVVGTPLNAANLNLAQESLVYRSSNSISTWRSVIVGPNGSDANNGATVDTPMATIQGAIRKYAKWHKYMDIYLLDGTYTEDVGQIATDQCSVSIRGRSENMDAVTLNMAAMLESHIQLLRFYHMTINMTESGVRPISINSGMLFANFVRFNMPAASSSNLINVYNGASCWVKDCILNAGTGSAVYGNQALHIRAVGCTSERTVGRGFNANNGSLIEYTPTLTATTMVTEAGGGKCIPADYRPGTVRGTLGSAVGQYMTYDGLLIQWGSVNITPTATNEPTGATLKFPFPYAETPTVLLTPVTTVPNTVAVGVMRSGDFVTDSKKEVGIMLVRSGTTTTGINWLAIGKGVI